MEKEIIHKSVLLQEVIGLLSPKTGGCYIDVTVGFGGHTKAILGKIAPNGRMLGVDQDEEALEYVRKDLAEKYLNLVLVKGNFSKIGQIAKENGFEAVDGIVADLGVSSYQLDRAERGFSFTKDAPLDMRMDKSDGVTARDILDDYSEDDLVRIFSDFGEERLSKTIAREIVAKRTEKPFMSTYDLAGLVEKIYASKGIKRGKTHPATRVFQAIRMEVNRELESLEQFLPGAVELLKPGGKMAVITFHSLEDRVVKRFFQKESKDCICPPEFPECRCKHRKKLQIITKKPIVASKEEINENPRSRSAKLRVAEKI